MMRNRLTDQRIHQQKRGASEEQNGEKEEEEDQQEKAEEEEIEDITEDSNKKETQGPNEITNAALKNLLQQGYRRTVDIANAIRKLHHYPIK